MWKTIKNWYYKTFRKKDLLLDDKGNPVTTDDGEYIVVDTKNG